MATWQDIWEKEILKYENFTANICMAIKSTYILFLLRQKNDIQSIINLRKKC